MFVISQQQKLLKALYHFSSNTTQTKNIEISLPSLSEQQRIMQEIESRLSQAEVAEARIAESL